MKIIFLLQLLQTEAFKRLFIIKSLVVSFVFILTALFFLNFKSYESFILADYPILSRLNILYLITIGSFQAVGMRDILFLFITALLFGINMELVLRKMRYLSKARGLKVTFGAGIITLAATGCASCGLSLASLVGLGGVVALLPFGGMELYILSIILLVLLLFYNLNSYAKACNLRPSDRNHLSN